MCLFFFWHFVAVPKSCVSNYHLQANGEELCWQTASRRTRDTFIATQALQCIMQIKQKEELKEVKLLRRQKKKTWQMWEMILGDISVPLNHITEGIGVQACTWSLAAPLVLVFLLRLNLSSLTCPLFSPPSLPSTLPLAEHLYLPVALVLLASNHGVLSGGFDTARLLCTKDDSHLRSHSAALSCKLPFSSPPPSHPTPPQR